MFSLLRGALLPRQFPKGQCAGFLSRRASTMNERHYDIIISGGGALAPTTFAAYCAKKPLFHHKRILLLQRTPPFEGFDITSPYGNRVSAINMKTIGLFRAMDVWHHMLDRRVKDVKQYQVWDAHKDNVLRYQYEKFTDNVACVLEDKLILDAMYNVLQNSPNVEVRSEEAIETVRFPIHGATAPEKRYTHLGLTSGEELSCEVLISGDANDEVIRKEMGVDIFAIDYARQSVVATLEMEDTGDNSIAWQRFVPHGAIALLPLNNSCSALVWTTSGPYASKLQNMSDAEFINVINDTLNCESEKSDILTKLTHAYNTIMGRIVNRPTPYPPRVIGIADDSRDIFPLDFWNASRYVVNGVALLGDAAHRIHPLAGQGANIGFADVHYLMQALCSAAYAGARLGDVKFLKQYEKNSLNSNVPLLIGVHGMQSSYSTTFSPIVLLRVLGLQFLYNTPQTLNILFKRVAGQPL